MLCCSLIKMINVQSKRDVIFGDNCRGGNYIGEDCTGESSWGKFSGVDFLGVNCPGEFSYPTNTPFPTPTVAPTLINI